MPLSKSRIWKIGLMAYLASWCADCPSGAVMLHGSPSHATPILFSLIHSRLALKKRKKEWCSHTAPSTATHMSRSSIEFVKFFRP